MACATVSNQPPSLHHALHGRYASKFPSSAIFFLNLITLGLRRPRKRIRWQSRLQNVIPQTAPQILYRRHSVIPRRYPYRCLDRLLRDTLFKSNRYSWPYRVHKLYWIRSEWSTLRTPSRSSHAHTRCRNGKRGFSVCWSWWVTIRRV